MWFLHGNNLKASLIRRQIVKKFWIRNPVWYYVIDDEQIVSKCVSFETCFDWLYQIMCLHSQQWVNGYHKILHE